MSGGGAVAFSAMRRGIERQRERASESGRERESERRRRTTSSRRAGQEEPATWPGSSAGQRYFSAAGSRPYDMPFQ